MIRLHIVLFICFLYLLTPLGAAGEVQSLATLPPFRQGGLSTAGTVKIPVILIDFPDYPRNPAHTVKLVYDKYFGDGIVPLPGGDYSAPSMRTFFKQASYGQLDLDGEVYGWYRSSRPRSSIDFDRGNDRQLLQEALDYFAGQGVDFSQYDNDRDGIIDGLCVNWTGPAEGFPWQLYSPIWHEYNITAGGKRINKLTWTWVSYWAAEDKQNSTQLYLDPEPHEMGHMLGLPDLYHFDYGQGPRGGVGEIDLMNSGSSSDINCFSKFLLGWLTPAVVTSGEARYLTLRPAGTNPDAVLIMPGASLQNPFSEYFMVQYRKAGNGSDTGRGYYTPLFGDGLAIWHIDAVLAPDGQDFLNNNTDTSQKLVRLMEADGLEEIEQGKTANPGDFYGPGKEFSPVSRPNSNSYAGQSTGVVVDSIIKTKGAIMARFSVGATLTKMSLTVSQKRVRAGERFTLTGRLTEKNSSAALTSQRVQLLSSKNQTAWAPAAATNTKSGGKFRFSASLRTRGVRYYQVRYPGNSGLAPAWTSLVEVTAR
jgi:M6 family metalloprotease-like protein